MSKNLPVPSGYASRRRPAWCAVALLAACGLPGPFGAGETYVVSAEFIAVNDPAAVVTDSTGRCTARTGDVESRATRFPAFWEWVPTDVGRADLAALRVSCVFGPDFEDGTLMLAIPNVRPTHPVRVGTYRIVPFAPGAWRDTEDPSVAWLVVSTRGTRSRMTDATGGSVEITQADARTVRGVLHVSTRR